MKDIVPKEPSSMNELENGIMYGKAYHTFYLDLTEKEKKRLFFRKDKIWVVTTTLRLIMLYIPLFFVSLLFVIKGDYSFILAAILCVLLGILVLTRKKTALKILDRGKVVFDENGAHYTIWLRGRYYRTEHAGYDEIGRIKIGNISVEHMPRFGRQPIISKEVCAETFGKFINVYGLGTHVLFAMQYTDERLEFFKSHCNPAMPITYDESQEYRSMVRQTVVERLRETE